MQGRLDAAFATAGKARGPDFQIIITPPVAMPVEAMVEYAELGVHRLAVNLGSQRPEHIRRKYSEFRWLSGRNSLAAPHRLCRGQDGIVRYRTDDRRGHDDRLSGAVANPGAHTDRGRGTGGHGRGGRRVKNGRSPTTG